MCKLRLQNLQTLAAMSQCINDDNNAEQIQQIKRAMAGMRATGKPWQQQETTGSNMQQQWTATDSNDDKYRQQCISKRTFITRKHKIWTNTLFGKAKH